MNWSEKDLQTYRERQANLGARPTICHAGAPNAPERIPSARGGVKDAHGANLESGQKKSKYRSQKVEIDGITFDSKKEGERYRQLKMMESAGNIHCLELQVPFVLAPAVVLNGRTKPALRYIADFQYFEADALQYTIEDVKSEITRKLPVYRIKIHLMKSVHGLDVVEI